MKKKSRVASAKKTGKRSPAKKATAAKAGKKLPSQSAKKSKSASSVRAPRATDFPGLVGVIHLPPLPGAPILPRITPVESLRAAGLRAVEEAILLEQNGFEALIIENFGDTPFFKTQVPAETIVAMSVIAAAVREVVQIPVGINVLRNDAYSAMAIASVTGCDFFRVNVLSGVVAADQGIIEGDAAHLLREKHRLGADQVQIWADVLVKHAVTLSTSTLSLAIEEAAHRGNAEAIILTGETTGRAVAADQLTEASQKCRSIGVPLYIGSGATAETLQQLRPLVSGVIVGSALRKSGKAGQPLDPKRIREFVQSWKRALQEKKKRLK